MRTLYWDCETRSKCDLRACGAWKYAADPTTAPLFVSWAVDNSEVATWRPGDSTLAPFRDAAANPAAWQVIAHNFEFERAVLEHVLAARHGFPLISLESWHCTMRLALANVYPAELGALSAALELPYRKDFKAARALREVSRPRKAGRGKKHIGMEWDDDPDKLELVRQRCVTDVETMRAVWQHPKPRHLSETERRYQLLDAEINRRGVRCDQQFVGAARDLAVLERNAINAHMALLTEGSITSVDQTKRILEALNGHGHGLASLGKRNVAAALSAKPCDYVRQLLELRRDGARSSVRKFERILAYAGEDDRLRGTLRMYGAGPGRWSGSGPMLQNLKRNDSALPLSVVDAVRAGDRAHLAQFGNPLSLLGDVSRASLCAAPNHVLMAVDFGAIESRVLAWLAGETWKLEAYREYDRTSDRTLEPYRVIAAQMLRKAASVVTDKERQMGKAAELAAGFGGSVGAWRRIKPDDPRPDHEIAQDIANWRRAHPRTCRFWKRLLKAVNATFKFDTPIRVDEPPAPPVVVSYEDGNLYVTLPSGRAITYPNARLVPGKYDDPDVAFHDNAKGGWKETRAWFGTLVENVVQGSARDLLAAAIERFEARGIRVVHHVHDEVVAEIPIGTITEQEFLAILLEAPAWAENLPLAGSVYSGQHYLEAPEVPAEPLAPIDVDPVELAVDAFVASVHAEFDFTPKKARAFEREDTKDFLDGLGETDAPLYELTSFPLTEANKCACPFHEDPMPSCQLYADHFHCFGCNAHGDRLTWLTGAEGMTRTEAVALLRDWDGCSRSRCLTEGDAKAEKTQRALELWAAAGPIAGTIAERYLAQTRAIDISRLPADIHETLRFHDRCPFGARTWHPCLVALMRDPKTNEPTGIHRIALRPGADKVAKIERLALGQMGLVKLWQPNSSLVVGEGIETTLAAAIHFAHDGTPLTPAWSSVFEGGMKRLPVLPDVKRLTLVVDHDKNGAGQKAASVCEQRWHMAGRSVVRLMPNEPGTDFNDLLMRRRQR